MPGRDAQTRWCRETETYIPDPRQAWSFTITVRVRGTREQATDVYKRYSMERSNCCEGITDALSNTVCSVSSKITAPEPGDLTIAAYEKAKA